MGRMKETLKYIMGRMKETLKYILGGLVGCTCGYIIGNRLVSCPDDINEYTIELIEKCGKIAGELGLVGLTIGTLAGILIVKYRSRR